MADGEEEIIPQTLQQKLLFYTTAFFILLGTFSLFAFLFLVPFVIDPAFTTIFMDFETKPAWCVTVRSQTLRGVSNCTWSSCREGCTKELFTCTQVLVNYKLEAPGWVGGGEANATVAGDEAAGVTAAAAAAIASTTTTARAPPRRPRAIREYDDYIEESIREDEEDEEGDGEGPGGAVLGPGDLDLDLETPYELILREGRLGGNDSEWYFEGARLYPNVKGCGYPPMLVCPDFFDAYGGVGTNYSCFYSKVDPRLVISELDMHQVYMNLVYAMAIPIPSFIISVIYLTFAYFYIYNEEEEGAEGLVGTEAGDGEADGEKQSPLPKELTASGALTPASDAFREDLASFGHQLKVAMADEMSRESVATAGSLAPTDGASSDALGTGNTPPPLPPPPVPVPVPPSASIPRSAFGPVTRYYTNSAVGGNPQLEQDDDDQYLNSRWADSGSLKRQFHGPGNIS